MFGQAGHENVEAADQSRDAAPPEILSRATNDDHQPPRINMEHLHQRR